MRADFIIIENMGGDSPRPKMLWSIIMTTAEEAGKMAGKIGALIIFSLLIALLFTVATGFFIDYPLTWGNFGKTWIILLCFNFIKNSLLGKIKY